MDADNFDPVLPGLGALLSKSRFYVAGLERSTGQGRHLKLLKALSAPSRHFLLRGEVSPKVFQVVIAQIRKSHQ